MNDRNAGSARTINDRDAGSASLWALSLAMVLWVCVAAIVLAGVAVVARHRAASAADMSALAAASVLARSDIGTNPDGGSSACAAAGAIAVANNAIVTSCQVIGQVVDVTTRVGIPALSGLGGLGLDAASARARAGPG
jgi:secretion/DNA translocation related TadE-like protein